VNAAPESGEALLLAQERLSRRRAANGIDPRPIARPGAEETPQRESEAKLAQKEPPGDVLLREVERGVSRRAASRAPGIVRPMEIAAPTAEQDDNDAFDPRVPPGLYDARFRDDKRVALFGRDVWVIRWRLTSELESAPSEVAIATNGITLRMFLTALGKNVKPRSGHAIACAYCIATGLRPQSDFWRRRPSWFLKDCVFRVRVRDIQKDQFSVTRPEGARYSRVQALVERVAGCPPCLIERGKGCV
jgi:hypothetical protein